MCMHVGRMHVHACTRGMLRQPGAPPPLTSVLLPCPSRTHSAGNLRFLRQ